MMSLELAQNEVLALRTLLEHNMSDLSVEIAGTDRKAYRDDIKAERTILMGILGRLSALETKASKGG